MRVQSINRACRSMSDPTLKKDGKNKENGYKRQPTANPTAGMKKAKCFAYARALFSFPAPICFRIMIPAALPKPMTKTHDSCEIVPVILKAAMAFVPMRAKIAFSKVIPVPHKVSLNNTGSAVFINFATNERSKLKSSFNVPQGSYFFEYE